MSIDQISLKAPKRMRLGKYVTCSPVAPHDVRRARDRQDWLFLAERVAACTVTINARHRRLLYRNAHGLFLQDIKMGACGCSRQHWHARLLSAVQADRKVAEKARRAQLATTNRENRLASKRALASGAFSLEL